MPWLWIVAGPNGAGKTTFAQAGIIEAVVGRAPLRLDPDARATELLVADPNLPEPSLRAAEQIDADVAACIERGEDVLVETVLSSPKFIDDVERARALGFQIGMIYVGLSTPDDAVRRVALRAARGGHNVSPTDVARRYERSAAMLSQFVPLLDALYVFDNSELGGVGTPKLIAYRNAASGKVVIDLPGRISAIDAALAAFT